MENNFYTDDFESFLKDTTDNFRLYPSKKLWHSLYNDLHPGRRWPSLAVCLLLICAVLFIGISNNNSINNISRHIASENILQKNKNYSADRNITAYKENVNIVAGNSFTHQSNIKIPAVSTNNLIKNNNPQNLFIPTLSAQALGNKETASNQRLSIFKVPVMLNQPEFAVSLNVKGPGSMKVNNNSEEAVIKKSTPYQSLIKTNKLIAADTKDAAKINAEDKSWMEDYAFHNKAAVNKWKKNAVFQYYLTPSAGFRKLYKNNELLSAAAVNNGLLVTNTTNTLTLNDKITQSSAINIETGGMVLYSVSKKIRLKSGLQFNYTSYNVDANELQHPNQTNLLLNDLITGNAFLSPRISFYANSISDENKKKLKNNTLQLSIPIGADYKLAGKNNLKWYAGATLQPTFIAGGHLYALSADEKNYVEDKSLLRQWNMNASVETFLSYKTINGVIISAGPQLRYQLFSTYDKRFTYTEKLYNLGVRLGITTNF